MWGNTLKNMTDWLKWQNRRKPKWKQTCWEVVGATDVVHSFWFLFEVVVCPYWYCVVLLFIRFSWRNVSDNKNFATREGLTSDVISGCHVGQPPETARNIRTHASCQFHIKYSKGNDKENRGGGKRLITRREKFQKKPHETSEIFFQFAAVTDYNTCDALPSSVRDLGGKKERLSRLRAPLSNCGQRYYHSLPPYSLLVWWFKQCPNICFSSLLSTFLGYHTFDYFGYVFWRK